MAISRERARPGPKPKGVRRQFTLRVPDDQYEVYQGLAAEAGMPVSDYLAVMLARHHGLPDPEYVLRKRRGGDMLPLPATG